MPPEPANPQTSQRNLTTVLVGAGKTGALQVASSAFTAGSRIPDKYSDYGGHISPPLTWSGPPATTRTFAIVLEDPDAKGTAPQPYVHWILYNLPADARSLPESVPTMPRLKEFGGALQGQNTHGSVGYFGPRPPAGDPPHHYHFQVFALDAPLDLPPGADKATVVSAMQKHVVSHGEIVGTFEHQR